MSELIWYLRQSSNPTYQGDSLSEHLTKARETLENMVDFVLGLSVSRGEELVTKWEEQYQTCMPYMASKEDKNQWSSPYRMTLQKCERHYVCGGQS